MFSRNQIALRYALYLICAMMPTLISALKAPAVHWPLTLCEMILAGAVVLRAYADKSTANIEPHEAATATINVAPQRPSPLSKAVISNFG